jgi:hypothetical protein
MMARVDLDALDARLTTVAERVEHKKVTDDPFTIAEGIRPHWFYRRTSPETLRIIGHKSASSVNEAIADGTLPPLVPLTAKGRACGWFGFQLVDYVKGRMAAAQVRAVALSDPARPKHPGGRPPKKKPVGARLKKAAQ